MFRKTAARSSGHSLNLWASIKDFLHSIWLCVSPRYRLLAYSGLMWLGQRIYGRPCFPGTQRLPFDLYAKYRCLLPETLATQYLYEKTSVPVPKVLDVIPLEGTDEVLMIMNRLPGVMMGRVILEMTQDELKVLISDTRDCLNQWRSLEPPSQEEVTGFLGSPLRSFKVYQDGLIGPFRTKDEFHDRVQSRIHGTEEEEIFIKQQMDKIRNKQHRIVFTHGDFRLGNILVQNKRLSGILDWECCGWMPEYWEYTTARYFCGLSKEVQPIMKELFPGYEEEFAADRPLWRYNFPW